MKKFLNFENPSIIKKTVRVLLRAVAHCNVRLTAKFKPIFRSRFVMKRDTAYPRVLPYSSEPVDMKKFLNFENPSSMKKSVRFSVEEI